MTANEIRKELLASLGPYPSWEELYFSWYLDDLKKHGYIYHYEYQPEAKTIYPATTIPWTQQLKTKTVMKDHSIFSELTYTTDFKIFWEKKALGVFANDGSPCINRPYFMGLDSHDFLEEYTTEVDVKGDHSLGQSKKNFSQYSFPFKQKMCYSYLGIYVQKIIPAKLFSDTFVPKRYFFTDTGKPGRKLTKIKKPLTISEYIEKQSSFKKK